MIFFYFVQHGLLLYWALSLKKIKLMCVIYKEKLRLMS